MNIATMAASYLTPMIIDKIASSLGITSPLAVKAIGAILPTILAGILGASSKPDGLTSLSKALGQQDPGLLGNLGNLIGGSGQSAMINAGTSVLGSLLGNSAAGSMAGAVAKFAGIGDAPAKNLIGMLAPVALGTIAKQQKDSGLDTAGLGRMLMGQKDNIQAAMPAGFADLLKGTGLLDALGAPAKAQAAPAASTSSSASRPTASAPPATTAPRIAPSSGSGWLPWVAGLGLLALAAWYIAAPATRQAAFPVAPKITIGTQDVGAQLGSVVEDLRGTLTGLKDEASARTALPRLQAMQKQLDTINGLRGTMPADGKSALAGYINTLLPLLRPLLEKALATAGVGAIAKPVLDQIFSRIESMSKA